MRPDMNLCRKSEVHKMKMKLENKYDTERNIFELSILQILKYNFERKLLGAILMIMAS